MSLQISLPHAGIVLLVGPSNSGKTTLLNRLVDKGILQRSEIVSSDQFRVLVSDVDFIDLTKHSKEEQEVLYAKYQQVSEKALGIEGVKRFVNKEPVARVHECVLATLALETEPVDPRL